MSNFGSCYPTQQITNDASCSEDMQFSSPLRPAAPVSSIQSAASPRRVVSHGPYNMSQYRRRPHVQHQVRSSQGAPRAHTCAGSQWWCCREIANQHSPVGANIVGYDACPGCGHWRCAVCLVR